MNKNELLSNVVDRVESDKTKESSPYPAEMIARLSGDELTQNALDKGICIIGTVAYLNSVST